MPACKIVESKILGQDKVREIENVPLSNSKINRCIDDMSHDAEDVLWDKLKNKSFSVQVDESTNFTNMRNIM
jgi:hypothetical protein